MDADMNLDEPLNVGENNMSGGDLGGGQLNDTAMMDNIMNDDLFGEAPDTLDVALSLPPAPLPAAVISHTDTMQRLGCCSTLAWSATGFAAQISQDGRKITCRTNLRDPGTGTWSLSDEAKVHGLASREGVPFVHIQFSGTGQELAAADLHGGVHVYTVQSVLGRMEAAPSVPGAFEGNGDGLDAVVGLHWLPLWPAELRTLWMSPATKNGDRWTTSMRPQDPHAARVHHALEGRNALLYMTRTSKLVLLYQNQQGIWDRTSIQAEEWHSSEGLLTHAAIGADGDHLVLVTHDFSRRFRVYRVAINWNKRPESVGLTSVSPVLGLAHLAVLDRVATQAPSMAKLSKLAVVPRVPQPADGGQTTATTVLTVFTHAPIPINGVQQEPVSVIARWTLESHTPTLHSVFTKLKSNGPTHVQTAVTVLRRQPDIATNKLIMRVSLMYFNTMVAFANSAGTVDIYDRFSWTPVESMGDATSVSSLFQSGLEFTPEEHTPHLALSADASAMIYTKPDNKLASKHVTLRYGWQPLEDSISDTTAVVEAGLVSLARQYTILSTANQASDEVLAALPHGLSKDHRNFFLRHVLRFLCRNLDISMLDQNRQQQTVLREPFHARALSPQMVLGTKPDSKGERDFAGQFAYVYLNLRQISITMAQTFSSKDREALMRQHELISSLCGPSAWVNDILLFMIDTLAQIARDIQASNNTFSAKTAFERLIADTGNPTPILFLASFPRAFLGMNAMIMKTFITGWLPQGIQRTRSVQAKEMMINFLAMVKNMPFRPEAMVEMLAEFDAAVRKAYNDKGVSGERRNEAEIAMIVEGIIPDELESALEVLVGKCLTKLQDGAQDMGKLYFWDFRSLDGMRREERKIDTLRKTKLPTGKDVKMRVCRRCGAGMEDVSPEELRGNLPDWMKHGQKICFCQGSWWVG